MKIRGTNQIMPGSVIRTDMDTTTAGSAVITKVISSARLTLVSTGVDSGTGDVTLDLATTGISAGRYTAFNVDVYGRVLSGSTLAASDLPTSPVVPGTYTKTTVDAYGRVTAGMNLTSADIPANSTYYIQNQVATVQTAGFSVNGVGSVGSIKLLNSGGTFGVSLAAPASQASNVTFVLPGYQGGANTTIVTDGNGNLSWATAGTVTSVGLSLPSEFTVSNSPVTASGSLTATWASKPANYVFAGPTVSAGTPSFRALIAADIPVLAYLPLSGGSVTGTVTITATPNVILQTALSAVNSQGCYIQNKLQDANTAYQTYSATHTDIVANDAGAHYGKYAISVALSGVLTDVATFQSSQINSNTKHVFSVATTSLASINIPHTTNAPTSPVDGDVWTTTAGLFIRVNGSTVQVGSGSGTVTSVGLTAPSIFTVSNSPVTSSGTIGLSFNTVSQNLVLAGPTSGSAIPTFRALVAADIPSLSATYLPLAGGTLTGGLVLPAATTTLQSLIIPHGTAPTTPTNGSVWTTTTGIFFRINGATRTVNTSAATVTSVALTMPSIFSVAGSPITTSGTFAVTLASAAANSVFAGPNGSAGTPSFRSLVAADIPTLSYLPLAGGTMTGKITTVVATTSTASINVGNGVDPTTPVSGDVWNASNDLYFYNGSASAKIFNSVNLTALTLPGGPYLALAGGTLTGALGGTSASFSAGASALSLTATGLTSNAFVYSAAGGLLTSSTLLNSSVSYNNFGVASNTVTSSLSINASGYGITDANGLGWNAAFTTGSSTYFGITQTAALASNYKSFVIGANDGRVQLSIDKTTNVVSVPSGLYAGAPTNIVGSQSMIAVSGGSAQVQSDSRVLLLMHMDGSNGSRQMFDMTGKYVTSNGKYPTYASLSTTASKFGGSSLYLNGTTYAQVQTSTSDFNVGAGDFTVDFWVNFSVVTGTQTIVDVGGSASGVRIDYNGSAFVLYIAGTSSTITFAAAVSTWYHIAVTRVSGVVKFFIGGASTGSPTGTGSLTGITVVNVGCSVALTQMLTGYVDELRVLSAGAWTASFTPPTNPYDYGSLVAYGQSESSEVKALVLDKAGRATAQRVPRIMTVSFALGETVTNTPKYFYVGRCLGTTQDDAQRSGSSGGMGYQNSCSPFIVPFNGKLTQATLRVTGVGVNTGTVSYPVAYNTQLYRVGASAEHDPAINGGSPVTLAFNIRSAYTVNIWSAGSSTNAVVALSNLSVQVNAGDPLALKFVNGSTTSVAAMSMMAFVTIVIEETI